MKRKINTVSQKEDRNVRFKQPPQKGEKSGGQILKQ